MQNDMIDKTRENQENKEFDIRFEMLDEFGNYFETRARADSYRDMGMLVEIGTMFNNFLRLVGFSRERDFILMEDISEDEYNYLQSALDEYRDGKADADEEPLE